MCLIFQTVPAWLNQRRAQIRCPPTPLLPPGGRGGVET